jgi:hypothetical protein
MYIIREAGKIVALTFTVDELVETCKEYESREAKARAMRETLERNEPNNKRDILWRNEEETKIKGMKEGVEGLLMRANLRLNHSKGETEEFK